MSYCRWSSDDFQSDVYVYEDVSGGWTTHVAARRVSFSREGLPPVEDYIARDSEILSRMAAAEYSPIGLPHDGASFNDPTASACADRLEALRVVGYTVPQDAIDALRAEPEEAP